MLNAYGNAQDGSKAVREQHVVSRNRGTPVPTGQHIARELIDCAIIPLEEMKIPPFQLPHSYTPQYSLHAAGEHQFPQPSLYWTPMATQPVPSVYGQCLFRVLICLLRPTARHLTQGVACCWGNILETLSTPDGGTIDIALHITASITTPLPVPWYCFFAARGYQGN
jgi:hypothetical protein